MTDLTHLTIKQALNGMANKDFTSVELTQAHIKACENAKHLNCFITDTHNLAIEQAKASDEKRAKGYVGILEGIPLGMKDLYCTKNVRTTAASKILGNFIPKYESTVSQNMLDQGMVMLGKLNLDEFAMGSSNETSAYGNVINPWKRNNGDDADLVPGGSSGGSSAAVAARIVMGATGTDTGGSIRQPASFTGIAGIKPTYGRCSRWGIVAFASSLDQAGPMARSVEDCALMLQAMAGHDEKDSTSVDMPVPDFASLLTGDMKGKKVGIPTEYRIEGLSDEIDALWESGIQMMKEAGAEIVTVSLPHTKYGLPAYYIIAPAECSSNLARYDGVKYGVRVEGENLNDMYERTRAAGFGEEVRRRILTGTYVLSAGYYDAYYKKAQRIRSLIKQDFDKAFEKCDVILTPTAPSAAFGFGEKTDDPIAMYLNDVFTVTVNMAGLPAMSVPAGVDVHGLPLGLQIIGKPFDEEMVLNAGYTIERAANFTAMPQSVIGKKAA